MADYTLVSYENPILRERATKLKRAQIPTQNTRDVVELMRRAMRENNGVGLAAPQLGIDAAVIVIENPSTNQSTLRHKYSVSQDILDRFHRSPFPFQALFNPSYEVTMDQQLCQFEGCLSRPGFMAVVPRPLEIRVSALDEYGDETHFTAFGFKARVLCHEIDHLCGKQYFDRMIPNSMISNDEFRIHWIRVGPEEIAARYGWRPEPPQNAEPRPLSRPSNSLRLRPA